MLIQKNISLKEYNTFGIDASAQFFTIINSVVQLQSLIKTSEFMQHTPLMLGGGSNILLTKNFEGIVVKNNIKGIEILKETNENIYVKCAAGEIWHEFVTWCINKNYAGIENLSLIPGCVGASPMQNIGAYGVEIKDVFYELEAIDLKTGDSQVFSKSDCEFGYRESVFKRKLKNQYMITSVSFCLSKTPQFNIEYGAIKQELDKMGISELTIQSISQAIINIRSSKLPNPKEIGNAGSFFKNPEITSTKYHELKKLFPNLVAYQLESDNYKLAAGWLIEHAGLKGYKVGDAGVHNLQALVLVNYGTATGKEIFDLSTYVMDTVKQKFNVQLEREVNIV